MDSTFKYLTELVEKFGHNKISFLTELKEKTKDLPENQKGNFLLDIGYFLYNSFYYELALDIFSNALDIFIKNDDLIGLCESYGYIGMVFICSGNYKNAVESHEKSLELSLKINDDFYISTSYLNLGVSYRCIGKIEKAIECYNTVLEISKKNKNIDGEIRCYVNLAAAYQSLEFHNKVIELYQKAINLTDKLTNDRDALYTLSTCFNGLGIVYDNLGDYNTAEDYFLKSIDISIKIENLHLLACNYQNIALVYQNLCEFQKVIDYNNKSIQLYDKLNDEYGLALAFINLANLFLTIGAYDNSLHYFEESLKISSKNDYNNLIVEYYLGKGNLHLKFKQLDESLKNFEKCKVFAERINDKRNIAKCLTNIAIIFSNKKEYSYSIEQYLFSLKIIQELNDKLGEASLYSNLGTCYRNLHEYINAENYYLKSLKLATEIGNINIQRMVNINLALLYGDNLKKIDIAYQYCKEAIKLIDYIYDNIIDDDFQQAFSSQVFDAFQYIVPWCLDLNKKEEALEFVEMSKSRAFRNLLSKTEIKLKCSDNSNIQDLLDKERTCLEKLREIQGRSLKGLTISHLPNEVDEIKRDLISVYNEIEKNDPEYVYIRSGKSLLMKDIKDFLSFDRNEVIFLEFFTTKDNIFIFLFSSYDTNLQVFTISFTLDKLFEFFYYFNSNIELLLNGNISKKEENDINKRLETEFIIPLSDILIKPISEYFKKDCIIYIIPYGLLHYFPFHAFKLNNEPIIKSNPIAYIHSFSLLKYIKMKGSCKLDTSAVFATEQDFYEEANRISRSLNSKPYLGGDVVKEKVFKIIQNKDIIHFACHGSFKYDNNSPLNSNLELYDGNLTAEEIYNLDINSELVTLSACETGVNELSMGDDLEGLTRAFLYAGTPSVIVSLWSVFNDSTTELMINFYENLKNGYDKVTSLQKAQITILEKEEYSNFLNWAPFILVGDWE